MAMRKLLFTLLPLIALLVGSTPMELHAQNTVNLHGRVTDNTGKPLAGA